MTLPGWLAALRPTDLMSAACALNPDASPAWMVDARWIHTPVVTGGDAGEVHAR